MRIPLTRDGLREIVAGSVVLVAAIVLSLLLFWPAALLFGLLWATLLAFFRDPERHAEPSGGELVSPADGTVCDVQEVQPPGAFLKERAVRIGIFMSVFDVHVNRSPADGTVRYRRYSPGKFHDARRPAAAAENEHNLIGIELADGRKVMVNQIAGVIARRIVCKAQPGCRLKAGERYGMVKFGSRVELFVPQRDQFEVAVKPGDKVKGGIDVLVVYTPGAGTPDRTAACEDAAKR